MGIILGAMETAGESLRRNHRSFRSSVITSLSVRRLSQLGFLLFIITVAVQNQMAGEGSATVVPEPEAFCPFGGLETLYLYITSGGQLVKHTSLSNVVLAGAVLLTAFLARSAFCGWVCPFGFLQDLVSGLSTFLQKRVPGFRQAVRAIKIGGRWLAVVDRPLRLLKYALLVWSVGAAATYGFMVFRDYDPWAALLDIAQPTLTFGMIVLLVTLVASFFVDRPWCRYACPLGAISGLFGWMSPVHLKREESACKECGLCSRMCPVGLDIHTLAAVNHPDCMGCLECVAACPLKGALELKVGVPVIAQRGPAVKLNHFVYGALALAIFMGTISVADANGLWNVSRKIPMGTNVEEIKGSMMLGDISRAYKVPIQEILVAFELPPGTPPTAKVKDLRSESFSPSNLRSWLQQRLEQQRASPAPAPTK